MPRLPNRAAHHVSSGVRAGLPARQAQGGLLPPTRPEARDRSPASPASPRAHAPASLPGTSRSSHPSARRLFRRRKGISRRHSTPYAFRKKPCLMNSPCIWPFRSMRGNIPSSSFSTRSPLLPQAGAPGSNRPFQSRLASRSHGQDTPFRIAGSTHEEGTIRRR